MLGERLALFTLAEVQVADRLPPRGFGIEDWENLTRDDQIEAEIAQTNQLMPTDTSLAATLFIPLPQDEKIQAELKSLVGLDEHVILHLGDHAIRAAFETGRSTEDKISAVQYLRFPLTAADRVGLSWTDNSDGESGFKIERSPDGVNNWVLVGNLSGNGASASVGCPTTRSSGTCAPGA